MKTFKNYSLSRKLISGFLLVALIAAAIGIIGIIGMYTVSNEDEEMYEYNTKPLGSLATMYDTLASERICLSNMAMFRESDPAFAQEERESLAEKEALFEEAFDEYGQYMSNDAERVLYDELDISYHIDFTAAKENVKQALASGDSAAIDAAIKAMDSAGAETSGYMDEAFALNVDLAQQKVLANKALYYKLLIVLIVVGIAGIILSIWMGFFNSNLIGKPIGRVLEVTKQVGETGSFEFSDETVAGIKSDAEFEDETGQMAASFSLMMDALIEKTKLLEIVASGDLTANVPLVSEKDTIGNALHMMLNNLNKMFGEINIATEQVASGSGQIATGAQTLAQATTEQSTTVELLSHTVSDIATKTKSNAERAEQAASLATTIKDRAQQGSQQMTRMIQAVTEINEASKSISSVIKVIDDIAFQTNILSLNAAVEAARAGMAGQGFAVVADEVRNLAAKSAEAASDTGVLIADSVQKAELGARIAQETAEALEKIVAGIGESTLVVTEIAQSSEEQSNALVEIENGIEQVTQVVQQNSATAEESAAASEEMSGQSAMLRSLVSQFKLRDNR